MDTLEIKQQLDQLKTKQKELKFKIEQLWIHQFTYKILINRI